MGQLSLLLFFVVVVLVYKIVFLIRNDLTFYFIKTLTSTGSCSLVFTEVKTFQLDSELKLFYKNSFRKSVSLSKKNNLGLKNKTEITFEQVVNLLNISA